mmetsp:Transcript_26590/g.39510  ORF Transcript_26590/g.39510 Transcript_26590/m.39510 type:complete len:112 (+) Transcript_26590:1359-1694(+)
MVSLSSSLFLALGLLEGIVDGASLFLWRSRDDSPQKTSVGAQGDPTCPYDSMAKSRPSDRITGTSRGGEQLGGRGDSNNASKEEKTEGYCMHNSLLLSKDKVSADDSILRA